MKTYSETAHDKLKYITMTIIITVTLYLNAYIFPMFTYYLGFRVFVSLITSIVSYQVLIFMFRVCIENSRLLLRLYWGRKLYLQGYWYYSYVVQGEGENTYYGIWEIIQNLNGIIITGTGYAPDFSVRTELNSVTNFIQNGDTYDIVHRKTSRSNPDKEYYAKSSISLTGNLLKTTVFKSTTYIYGGEHVEKTHMDKFYKLKDVNDMDSAFEAMKKKVQEDSDKK